MEMNRAWIILLLTVLLAGLLLPAFQTFADEQVRSVSAPGLKPDPSGANTGGVADVVGASRGAPTMDDMKKLATNEPLAVKLADEIGHSKIAINFIWTLICGFLVFFMQVGFAMMETGFTRTKNAGHTMAMNMMVFVFGVLGYWVCGYAFQMGGAGPSPLAGGTGLLNGEFALHLFGKDFGFFGTTGFFLSGQAYDVSIITLFLFQVVLMDVAATIPTGAMAERWSFKSLVIFGFFISMVTYPLYANWVWGGGWLSMLGKNFGLGHGVLDFAGSSVVHMVGGVSALAGAIVLGPRMGKYKADGTPNAMPGHNIPMAIVGCLILFFGWLGFNSGSTLAGGDLRIGVIAVNTMLASCAACFSAMCYMWVLYGKPDLSVCANGLLAGLVSITAACAFVSTVGAVMIGLIGGVLCCVSIFFVERRLKVDDPVGAISVHGTCGAWGLLGLGLFADGTYGDGLNGVAGAVKGLFYGGASQFAAEVIGVVVNFIFVFAVMYGFFKLLNRIIPVRVSPEVEFEGLDQNEVSVTAYPDFGLKTRR
jgi:Amt family ammonium transporter